MGHGKRLLSFHEAWGIAAARTDYNKALWKAAQHVLEREPKRKFYSWVKRVSAGVGSTTGPLNDTARAALGRLAENEIGIGPWEQLYDRALICLIPGIFAQPLVTNDGQTVLAITTETRLLGYAHWNGVRLRNLPGIGSRGTPRLRGVDFGEHTCESFVREAISKLRAWERDEPERCSAKAFCDGGTDVGWDARDDMGSDFDTALAFARDRVASFCAENVVIVIKDKLGAPTRSQFQVRFGDNGDVADLIQVPAEEWPAWRQLGFSDPSVQDEREAVIQAADLELQEKLIAWRRSTLGKLTFAERVHIVAGRLGDCITGAAKWAIRGERKASEGSE